MAIGLVGRKCGMTRIFTDAGVSVPVTVIEVDPNRITQIKTLETDGYQAIQITTGERRESRVTNAQKGHFAKAGVAAGRLVQEFRATEADLEGREVGGTIGVDMFTVGQVVDVTGQSKGKGFWHDLWVKLKTQYILSNLVHLIATDCIFSQMYSTFWNFKGLAMPLHHIKLFR